MNNKIVCLLSGGMDSSTLVADFARMKYDVYTLSFNYGQKHSKELDAAWRIAGTYHATHKEIDMRFIKEIIPSAQTDPYREIPDGKYDEESMKQTVTPNRNMLLLSLAAAYSIALNACRVAYAAHAGDHTIYPDCRPAFVAAMSHVLSCCHFDPILLYTPFIHITKADIVKMGLELQVPYEHTWSCYKGNKLACGRCGTCVERLEAFHLAGAKDPLTYEDENYWKEKCNAK
jgi:7-cyano-7-deazaguanine synthase